MSANTPANKPRVKIVEKSTTIRNHNAASCFAMAVTFAARHGKNIAVLSSIGTWEDDVFVLELEYMQNE